MEFSDKFPQLNLYKVLNQNKDNLEENEQENEELINKNFSLDELIINRNENNDKIEGVYLKDEGGGKFDTYIERYLDRELEGSFGPYN